MKKKILRNLLLASILATSFSTQVFANPDNGTIENIRFSMDYDDYGKSYYVWMCNLCGAEITRVKRSSPLNISDMSGARYVFETERADRSALAHMITRHSSGSVSLDAGQLNNIVENVNNNTNARTNSISAKIDSLISGINNKIDSINSDLTNKLNNNIANVNNSINTLKSNLVVKDYNLLRGTGLPFTGTLQKSGYLGDTNTELYSTNEGLVTVTWYNSPTTVGDLIIK